VAGVLVEKAKTTPEAYPMSINALRTGCNQKNNRAPLMEVELEDVEESLSRLRAAGALTEVQGGGRVSRYRHLLYEWLGVDKVELAVMAELLLRGAQTEGELRGRAARMEPIADLGALRPVLASLKSKGLIVSLTPEGRGHVVTHALYEPREWDKVRSEHQASAERAASEPAAVPRERAVAQPSLISPPDIVSSAAATTEISSLRQAIDELRHELTEVRSETARLRGDLDDLRAQLS
jgi:hypothetical protein